jgi:signal transduction histidine kinase
MRIDEVSLMFEGGILLLMGTMLSITVFYSKKQARLSRELEAMKEQHTREIGIVQKEIYLQTVNDIATEFHDNLGGLLAAIKLELALAVEKIPAAERERLMHIQSLTQTFSNDFKSLTKSLITHDEGNVHLMQEIEKQVALVNRWGIVTAKFSLVGEPRGLRDKADLVLLRVFQESLNNVLAHSKASRCEISLSYSDKATRMEISDNGRGFDYEAVLSSSSSQKSMGLQNIRNRCKMIGATLEIDSRPNHGTIISINLPNNQE